MKKLLKSLLPENLLKAIRPWYHGLLAWDANLYFDRPSDRLIVVGITGTAGKSTTAAMLAHILNFAGFKTGYITTVNFFDGEKEYINKHGLSMPNEIKLQKQLHAMVINKCRVAIIECTSEGLSQNRHWGVNFDMAVFTNLSNAHLEAHGSFKNYRQAKGKLFAGIGKSCKKKFFPQKMIGINFEDPMAEYFLSSPADKKFGVSFSHMEARAGEKIFYARLTKQGLFAEFEINSVPFILNLPGNFNAQNAALAIACANMLGVELEKAAEALKSFGGVRGRMESVPNGRGIQIIVDYGCEPASFRAALGAANAMPHNKLIHVFGSTGGHRDVAKRFEFGKTSVQFADKIIITNDDVYNSNPQEIAANIEQGIKQVEREKLKAKSVEIVLDRREAIRRALTIARPNDLVLITGKGSEQFLVLPGNKRIDWDDCGVVREELGKLV